MKESGDPLRMHALLNSNLQNRGEQQQLLGPELLNNISTIPSLPDKSTLKEVLSAIDKLSNGNLLSMLEYQRLGSYKDIIIKRKILIYNLVF